MSSLQRCTSCRCISWLCSGSYLLHSICLLVVISFVILSCVAVRIGSTSRWDENSYRIVANSCLSMTIPELVNVVVSFSTFEILSFVTSLIVSCGLNCCWWSCVNSMFSEKNVSISAIWYWFVSWRSWVQAETFLLVSYFNHLLLRSWQ